MATENDDDALHKELIDDTAQADKSDKPERTEREPREAKEAKEEKPKSIRDAIKSAVKEHAPTKERRPRDPVDDKAPKEAVADKAAPVGDKAIPTKTNDGKLNEPAPQAPSSVAAPEIAPKEVKALWASLPPEAQAVFAKREADMAKGVEQLKAKYQSYDGALDTIRDELRTIGKTEVEAIRMLADWRNALRGPNKVQAFRALAQAEKIDLSTLMGSPSPQGQAQQAQQPNDPAAILRPYIDPITQKVTALESELQRRDSERVQGDIKSFSADKPHFDKVRVAMGHMMNSGLIPGSTPKEVFDEAYNRACRMDPEVFALIQSEEQAKREADAKAAQEAAAKKAMEAEAERKRKEAEEVARARKAGVGPRAGSPSGMATTNTAKGQSVGDSLRAAVKEVRATI